MKTRIEIDTNTFVRFWLVLAGFALAVFAIYSARHALVLIAVAFFLALALNIPVNFIASHLPGKSRILGTAAAYIAIVVALSAFVFLAVPPIVEQTAKFLQTIPDITNQTIEQWRGLGALINEYQLQPHINTFIASIQDSASDLTADAGRNIVHGAGSLISFLVSSVFVLVLTFLMLVEGPTWLRLIWGVYTDQAKMEHHRDIAQQMYRVVTGYVSGQLVVAGIGAVFSGMAVFILSLFFDIPGNLALPTVAVTFTLSLIPMFGATLAGVLITLLLAFNSVPAAIIYAVYFFIYQQIENNFVSPVIQSRRLELSALAVLVAVTVGFYVFGILGSLISIPIAGSIKVLLQDYFDHARKERVNPAEPKVKLAKKTSQKV